MRITQGIATEYQMFWPALDAAQRAVFDACEREALEIGIERKVTK